METFPRYWPFVWGIHWSPVNSPHKGQWRGALSFFFELRLNKHLSNQSRRRWFETPSHSLWRHRNYSHIRLSYFIKMPSDAEVDEESVERWKQTRWQQSPIWNQLSSQYTPNSNWLPTWAKYGVFCEFEIVTCKMAGQVKPLVAKDILIELLQSYSWHYV